MTAQVLVNVPEFFINGISSKSPGFPYDITVVNGVVHLKRRVSSAQDLVSLLEETRDIIKDTK